MGERIPMEFTAQCHQLKWLRNYLSGWQFGEQGLLRSIYDALKLQDGTVIEYGAGDGETLPVTVDVFYRCLGVASIYVEIDDEKRMALHRKYPLAAVKSYIYWPGFHDLRPNVVVIDIDGRDSVVMREMLAACVRPTLLVVEHMDRHVPIATTAPQPIPEWLLGQKLKSGHSIQDTAETLHQIALHNGYERIGWNRCNSFFVVKERFQELFR